MGLISTRDARRSSGVLHSADPGASITPAKAPTRPTSSSLHEHPAGRLLARPAPRLAGLAVLGGSGDSTQQDALDRLGLSGDEFARGIFNRSGVLRRHLNLDPDFLERNLQARSGEVEDELFRAATQAVNDLDVEPSSIGTVLTSSLYSLGCPSLAHRLIEHYRMPAGTDKYHVTGVGCASAVPLLRLAVQIIHSDPSRRVLVVAAESMSSIMMPARPGDPRTKTVGSAIFGDGCAAALLSADRAAAGPAILATRVHQIPNTLDAVQLTADTDDSHLKLAVELPALAADQLAELVNDFLRSNHLNRQAVDHWILHPGGRRIVEQARDALGLDDEDVAVSWRALAEHGNVGTPSIFYVLNDTIAERDPKPGEHGLAVTIGPGVTVGLLLLQF
ncbi:MAG: 3-oxoacyl-[acyl-carrier-protein] synthase III C-terminal domain-containing protein [Solirubrobacteraceae bacterium]